MNNGQNLFTVRFIVLILDYNANMRIVYDNIQSRFHSKLTR